VLIPTAQPPQESKVMERIESLDDARVAAYRNLPDRTRRGESLFVTEGRLVTRRLIRSDYEVESVFVAERFADEFRRLLPEEVPLYVAAESVLVGVVGFKFHLGVLGAGHRGKATTLDELMSRTGAGGPVSLVICPQVTKPENMGLIFRTASAFGVDGVLLGRGCCDPFSRRCLRLSMGGVLQVPLVQSTDLQADLLRLREHWGLELLATVLDEQAEPLADVRWPPRAGLLFGSEFEGLGPPWLALSDRRITIPMRPGMDSLNLGVAAGIFLYQWKGRGRPR
jgi:tRNA G18 (ribose-2'-O)-methylase SpoU